MRLACDTLTVNHQLRFEFTRARGLQEDSRVTLLEQSLLEQLSEGAFTGATKAHDPNGESPLLLSHGVQVYHLKVDEATT